MNQEKKNYNAITLFAGAIAGIVTVTSSSGPYDFTDTAIGMVIIILLWPLIKVMKTRYSRALLSVIVGLSGMLVVGIGIDAILGNVHKQFQHFASWLIISLLAYYAFKFLSKKTQQGP